MKADDQSTIAIIAAILLVGDRISTEAQRREGRDVSEMTYSEAVDAAIDVMQVTLKRMPL